MLWAFKRKAAWGVQGGISCVILRWEANKPPAMVDAEAPAPAEEAPQVDGTVEITGAEGAPADVPLKAPKRLPKPDKEAHEEQCKAMYDTMRARKARIQEINALLTGKKNQAESPQLAALKNSQAGLRAQWEGELVSVYPPFSCGPSAPPPLHAMHPAWAAMQCQLVSQDPSTASDHRLGRICALQSKKQHLRAELEKVTQARKDLRTQTRDMKAKLAYLTSGSKIDEQARACFG
jgi:hypothetical protein